MKEEVSLQTSPGSSAGQGSDPSRHEPGAGRGDLGRRAGGVFGLPLPRLPGVRGRPGWRVGGWSGRGAAVTCFHPSAAPGVPEDAEREGRGARYVLGPRRQGGCLRGGRWAPVVRPPRLGDKSRGARTLSHNVSSSLFPCPAGKLGRDLSGDPRWRRGSGGLYRKEQAGGHLQGVTSSSLLGEGACPSCLQCRCSSSPAL